MPRTLPTDDSDGQDYVQFRGPQTSVTQDAVGVRFGTEHRHGRIAHEALPVVDNDADPAEIPDNAVARAVAEQMVESNPLVCWGVACEECGDVFDSPKAVNSHQSAHNDGDGDDTDTVDDADTDGGS